MVCHRHGTSPKQGCQWPGTLRIHASARSCFITPGHSAGILAVTRSADCPAGGDRLRNIYGMGRMLTVHSLVRPVANAVRLASSEAIPPVCSVSAFPLSQRSIYTPMGYRAEIAGQTRRTTPTLTLDHARHQVPGGVSSANAANARPVRRPADPLPSPDPQSLT